MGNLSWHLLYVVALTSAFRPAHIFHHAPAHSEKFDAYARKRNKGLSDEESRISTSKRSNVASQKGSGRARKASGLGLGPAPRAAPKPTGEVRAQGGGDGTGRSRAAKRTAVYEKLNDYSAAQAHMLELERAEEARVVEAKLATRPLESLITDGLVVLGLTVEPKERFFRSYVVRLALPGGAVLPPHSLEPGDVVALTDGDTSPFPEHATTIGQNVHPAAGEHSVDEDYDFDDLGSNDEEDYNDDEKAEVLQGVVLEFGQRFVDVLFSAPVAASAESHRLSLYFSDVSYRRMEAALLEVASPDLKVTCKDLRQCLVDSFVELAPQSSSAAALRKEPSVTSPAAAAAAPELSALARGSPPWKSDKTAAKAALVSAEASAGRQGHGPLDASQTAAVALALKRRLSLIQGPPGTGKTRTACRLVAALVAMQRSDPARSATDRVLACALSNVAADNLLEGCLELGLKVTRVGLPVATRASLRDYTLEAAVLKDPAYLRARSKLDQCVAQLAASRDSREGKGSNARRGDKSASGARRSQGVKGQGASRSAVKRALEECRAAEFQASTAHLRAMDVVVCTCISAGTAPLLAATGLRLTSDSSSNSGGGGGRKGSNSKNAAAAAAGRAPDGKPYLRFASVVLDEATQATEPAALVPLALGARQIALVGDQCQLPPTVLSSDANARGFGRSLFERCLAPPLALEGAMLRDQYRMSPPLAAFSAKRFYGDKLRSVPTLADRPRPPGFSWPHASLPVAFLSVNGFETRVLQSELSPGSSSGKKSSGDGRPKSFSSAQQEGTSYCNPAEAKAVVDAVLGFLRASSSSHETPGAVKKKSALDVAPTDIGVVTPYSAQARLVTDLLAKQSNACQGVEVSSVDGYQGREKEVIVLSAVRANSRGAVGFVADWRRLNVAVTRARRGLVVVGDPTTLAAGCPHWRAYITWHRKQGTLMELGSQAQDPGTRAAL